MTESEKNVANLSINTIRTLTIDSVERAQHGHPGMPMGAAPMAYSLWKHVMNMNPKNPDWFNRDRFVLSAGHGSMLQYCLLHLAGYDLPLEELKNFRQLGSKTAGHPEFGVTPGVEVTTGPLGQGIPACVGLALAERHLAATYNREGYPIVDHYTYTICGDGDLMEGISYEAASLAGHLKLGRLIVLYDSNDISLDGELALSFSEDIKQRFESCHWQYLYVEDGNDVEGIKQAILEAKAEKDRPTIIEIKTKIGYGAPTIEGKSDAHSDPIGIEEIKRAKAFYKWNYEEDFYVPEGVYEDFRSIQENGSKKEEQWNELFRQYEQAHPELAVELKRVIAGELPENWDEDLPVYKEGNTLATRASASEVQQALANHFPELVGGSADLNASTKTRLQAFADLTEQDYAGRNISFGVREFAMGAIANGMARHYLKPFVSTFFVFSDYLRPAIRLSALMGLPVTYVFTHDSVAVGQDGPTHQPVEHLASFRAMPNITVVRPADANETKEAWKIAVAQKDRPTILVLGRQNVPTLKATEEKGQIGVAKGAYVISEAKEAPQGILIAAGSEVHLALKAQDALAAEGIFVNVVSMPSWDLFDKQTEEYKESVLPSSLQARLSIEMGSKVGWKEYTGCKGAVMSIDSFGVSGPGEQVIEQFGFTVENVVKNFKGLL
ncbi:transketolase [Virgibacillus pantothenticus]|uniref:Transketolase n=1 Tax=Virgibacillus pantothenticus TaxID=1473 RepID=A0A0L0QMV0_VIRPA|nr:transketolase [Virgibacillus pantothenticus]KNE19901.1 transketolase [Virgibacillus pantothenticus]MBU8564904.1 transketolase [Virgibacillus pantothenticus]MBU8599212.1 transketolase [Virgibacillus pantothenticus]MBU8633385.1 transketolase [Virgibacillus pantothenticus]MBU8640954.1 transketolase [Virgibacillus pantothenticus]